MADYPNSIYSPRAKANRSGVVYDANKQTVLFAEDIVKDDNEIVAIETELGTNPKGAYADVKDRLDDLPTKAETLTNKRITPRVSSVASSATPSINTDNCDVFKITALAENITNMSTNLSGTPTDTQKLIIKIRDNGTPRTINWGNSFVGTAEADMPLTTVTDAAVYVGFLWEGDSGVWLCVAVANEVV